MVENKIIEHTQRMYFDSVETLQLEKSFIRAQILFTKKPEQSSGKQTPTPPFRTPFIREISHRKTLSCKMISIAVKVVHISPHSCER